MLSQSYGTELKLAPVLLQLSLPEVVAGQEGRPCDGVSVE